MGGGTRSAGRGTGAEAAVLNAFAARDLPVLVPFGDGRPYDSVVDLGQAVFLRVQCKTAWERGGCLLFNSRTTDHGRGRRPYLGLADVFGVSLPSRDLVLLVPVAEAPNYVVSLRLEPTRNNQRRGVRFAADYRFDRWSTLDLREMVRPTRTALAAAG